LPVTGLLVPVIWHSWSAIVLSLLIISLSSPVIGLQLPVIGHILPIIGYSSPVIDYILDVAGNSLPVIGHCEAVSIYCLAVFGFPGKTGAHFNIRVDNKIDQFLHHEAEGLVRDSSAVSFRLSWFENLRKRNENMSVLRQLLFRIGIFLSKVESNEKLSASGKFRRQEEITR
jgi:hypothetical protein